MIYELVIEDENVDEVFAISLVENPAIEREFLYFNKEEVHFSSIDEEKRLVIGPILIPDKHIFRMDGDNVPYTVFFSKDTIQKLAENYLKRGYQASSTLEHDKKINGVTLVESWVVESRTKDKSALYNLNLPIGTWMGIMKIDSDEIWRDYVKTGKVKGFSIEGMFEHKLVSASKQNYLSKSVDDLTEEEAELLLSKISVLFESYADYGTEIQNNAKRGIELNEKVGNRCATQTGKVRAQQLANGEPISVETIKRMYSYLSRAETYYDESDTEACGTISYLLWGGKSALSWSRNKLRELGLLEEGEAQPSITSTYPGEVATGSLAPALLAELPEMNIYGYETEYFYICPGAVGTFNHLLNEMNIVEDDLVDMIRAAAVFADNVFKIEADVIEKGKSTPQELERAIVLVDMFKDIFQTVDERTGMKHDISYMDGHIEVIKGLL